jgi:LPXTG-motif cell wall-anchored protein
MKNRYIKNLILFVLTFFIIGFAIPIVVLSATTPSLGTAATYGILASTFSNTTAGTTVNGDVGFTTGAPVVPAGSRTYYGSGYPYSAAGTDQGIALSLLASQPCTFTFADGAINLSTDTTHGTIHIYTPGVYCSVGAMEVGGPLTLRGSGTYIFRPDGALTSAPGAIVTLENEASACDVFWTPTQATTLAANTIFQGTVIDDYDITVEANTTWTGRALAYGGTVTTDTATINVPSCTIAAPVSSSSREGTINVVKTVINDNGGTKTIGDFPLFVNGVPVVSGETNTFRAPALAYAITETSDSHYTQTFSGDCDVDGRLNLSPGENKFCIVTNNDIGTVVASVVPPLIEVVKVPTPLSLPNGPGLVNYNYTLRNIGTVPMTDVTMVGDTCSPIVLISGDANGDSKIDVNETWVYGCSTTLSETHTNTVVATGWANGLSAVDIASATVVVGVPIVPPLIHVIKIPNPLKLPAGQGVVTYTNRVTNPGTIALSNIFLADDKCSPSRYVSGDVDGDSKLDTAETWIYTCQTSLTETTTNTVTVSGEANGLIARDFAIATVVVDSPKLPQTGFDINKNIVIISIVGILMALLVFYIIRRSKPRD